MTSNEKPDLSARSSALPNDGPNYCDRQPGFVLWLTGLPGAGKSTLAGLIAATLEQQGRTVMTLDGDVVRAQLPQKLGFSRMDRCTNILQIGRVACDRANDGAVVLVAVIAPYETARQRVREMTEVRTRFVEVHVATPLEECMRRDPKGHYAKALRGEIEHFTGISDPYEEPELPELRLDTSACTAEQSAAAVIARLVELDLVSPDAPAACSARP